MGQQDVRGAEIAEDFLQIVENVFAGVGGAGGEGIVVGNDVGARERGAVRRDGAPVVVPDVERAGIGIAEEDDVVGGQAELGGGGEGLVLAAQARRAGGAGHQAGMAAGEQRRDLVVVAHGEEANPDGDLEGGRFLDQAAGGESLVAGVGRQHEDPVVVAEQKRCEVRRRSPRGRAREQGGDERGREMAEGPGHGQAPPGLAFRNAK